jgi:hypothetical protein
VAGLLRRAALDGHTAMPRTSVVAAVGAAAVQQALARGQVSADQDLLALPEVAAAEDALAVRLLDLAGQGRLAVVLGEVPAGAPVHVVQHAHRRSVEDLLAEISAVSDQARVVVAGDPDLLGGTGPGAVLADLLAWGGVPVRDLREPVDATDGTHRTALAALAGALRRGALPDASPASEPGSDAGADRSLVVVPCRSDDEVLARVDQLVRDSVPRVFAVAADQVLVVTPLRRGTAGARALAGRLPGNSVQTIHDTANGQLPAADAVVACFPAQAAGVITRSMVVTVAALARTHLSVVTAAGDALPTAVTSGVHRPRFTRLAGLLRRGAP